MKRGDIRRYREKKKKNYLTNKNKGKMREGYFKRDPNYSWKKDLKSLNAGKAVMWGAVSLMMGYFSFKDFLFELSKNENIRDYHMAYIAGSAFLLTGFFSYLYFKNYAKHKKETEMHEETQKKKNLENRLD